jgi:hypothetical protein
MSYFLNVNCRYLVMLFNEIKVKSWYRGEKQNVPPKLFFLTLFWEFVMFFQYGTHHSYVLVEHTLRVAENEILKLDLPAKRQ